MAITRHDPFRDLLQIQDRLFRQLDQSYGQEGQVSAGWTPLVDVFEDKDSITIQAEVAAWTPRRSRSPSRATR